MLPNLADGHLVDNFGELLAPDVWPAAMFADESIKVVQLVADLGMAPDSGSKSKRAVVESCGGGSSELDTTLSSSASTSSLSPPGDDISELVNQARSKGGSERDPVRSAGQVGKKSFTLGRPPPARKSGKPGLRKWGRAGVGEPAATIPPLARAACRPATKWKVPALGVPVPVNSYLESGKALGIGSGARWACHCWEQCSSAFPCMG